MKESQLVKQWQAEAKAEMLLQVLEKKFKTVPDDLRAAILAETDGERLTGLMDIAFATRSVTGFRRKAKL